MFELAGRSNYLRVDELALASPEFALLIALAAVFFFATKRRLIDLFVLSIPLTDQVYRVFQLQPSDMLAILLLLRHRRVYVSLGTPYLIVPIFLVSSVAGWFFSSSFFSLFYVLRYVLVLTSINFLFQFARDDGLDYYRSVYGKAVVLSVGLQVAQLVWWNLGFEQPGVFFLEGFPRVKGTAHEPATFAAMLALSIPFCIGITRTAAGLRVRAAPLTLGAILLGLILSLSVTGFVIALLLAALAGLLLFRFPIGRRTIVGTLVLSMIAAVALWTVSPEGFDYTVRKAVAYPTEMLSTEPDDANISGRASDLRLLEAVSTYPLFGIGVFNTALVARYVDVSAANLYISFLLELGIPMYLLFLAWLLALIRRSVLAATPETAVFLAGFLAWVVSLAGLRTFGFYLPWIVYACVFLSMARPSSSKESGS